MKSLEKTDKILNEYVIKEKIIDGGLFVLSILGMPILFISLSRIETIGFQPILLLHGILISILLMTTFFRKKISLNTRAWIIVSIIYLAGAGALANLAVLGSGWPFLALSTILAAIFLGFYRCLFVFVISCLTIVIVGWGYIDKKISLCVDLHDYVLELNTWANVLIDYILLCTCVISAFYFLNKALLQSLAEVKSHNKSLEVEVEHRTKALEIEKQKAEQLARTDFLTELNNRRAFFEFGELINEESIRYEHKYSIIMLDMDFFKKINDTYGHKVGDEVLQLVSKCIKSITRISDVSARIGGEEFAILLPETKLEQVVFLAKRLRDEISNMKIETEKGNVCFSASFGIASFDKNTRTVDLVLSHADTALYKAKNEGRNQIVIY